MTTHYTFLNDLGIVNAMGSSGDNILSAWQQGVSAGMKRDENLLDTGSTIVGKVGSELPIIPAILQQHDTRNNRLLLSALLQIENKIEKAKQFYGADRIGVVIGTSTSGIAEGEAFIAAGTSLDGYCYRQQEIGAPALFVADYYNLYGPCLTVSTACSSSAKALATARNWLDMALCDVVIAGGCDSLCRLTVNGFHALGLVAEEISTPFQRDRQGINIGEAAAVFVVSREKSPLRLAAAGESSDAHHISAPHPDGAGAERAMAAALQEAELQPEDIDYLNLHGTGTSANDSSEAKAVNHLFPEGVACSSTKPLTGHTLGAAGATEIGLCWLLMNSNDDSISVPSQILRSPLDDTLPPIDLLKEDRIIESKSVWRMLSNSFAFGGSNISLIIEKNNNL